MHTHPRLLLLAPRRDDLFAIGPALRDAGYLVFPARLHEEAVDAVIRVRPSLVLIDAAAFPAASSDECREAAAAIGARVLLFAHTDGPGDGAALQDVAPLPYPVLDYSGDARALAGLVAS
jgi:hypothetical protein